LRAIDPVLEEVMCQRVVCAGCGGATYRGCGNHVEQVLAGVPQAERCSCAVGQGTERRGLRRLFGRR